jgi:cysteine desulfurase
VIYLDNNATTRPLTAVCAAVAEACGTLWPNPSSVHREGQRVRAAIELARAEVAALIGAKPRELTFTSGGTESIHLAVRGVLSLASNPVFVTTAVEHAAVRDLAGALHRDAKAEIRWLPLGPGGVVDIDRAAPVIDGASLVSMQWANNETGAIQPVAEIAAICRSQGVPFHCDATQWVGKQPLDLSTDPAVDLLTFSAHKFHGPKGIGVLWVRRGLGIRPTMPGSQELGRRAGTENVPGILGMAAAATEARAWLADPAARVAQAALRDELEKALLECSPIARLNAPLQRSARLWNTTNIGFEALEAEALLMLLSEQGLCASAGAACSSGSLEPSPVLLAMGVPPAVAHGSIRLSLSRETSTRDIEQAVHIISSAVRRLA